MYNEDTSVILLIIICKVMYTNNTTGTITTDSVESTGIYSNTITRESITIINLV